MTMDSRTLERQPPAVTVPGEMWHLNGYALNYVIVDRPGIGPDGNHYRRADGQLHHTLKVGQFETVRDAACAVQARNAWEEVVAAWDRMDLSSEPKEDAETRFFYDVIATLQKYGRA